MTQPVTQVSEEQRLLALARYRLLDQAPPLGPSTSSAAAAPTRHAAGDRLTAQAAGLGTEHGTERQTGYLDESAADIREDVAALTRLAVTATGLPIAALNLFDATRQVQLSTVGFPATTSPRAESPCASHFRNGEVVHTPDASLDPRLAGNAHVDGRLGAMRAYASAPLVTADGYPLGTLCVADIHPRTLTADQLTALEDLSRVVISLFERRRQAHLSARLAAEADEQRSLAELLISEAEHRHRLLEAVFDSAGVGIVVADVDGHLMTMNSTATQWLGRPVDPRLPLSEHARAYDLRSADGTTLLSTSELPLHRALNEGPVDQVEMVIVAPDDTRRAVVCSARPLHDDDGVLTGAVAALHDVSVLRAREGALRDAHDQLTRHAGQAAALARAAHSITTAEDPRQAICDAVRDLMDADAAFLLQPRNGQLEATATSGLPTARTSSRRCPPHPPPLVPPLLPPYLPPHDAHLLTHHWRRHSPRPGRRPRPSVTCRAAWRRRPSFPESFCSSPTSLLTRVTTRVCVRSAARSRAHGNRSPCAPAPAPAPALDTEPKTPTPRHATRRTVTPILAATLATMMSAATATTVSSR